MQLKLGQKIFTKIKTKLFNSFIYYTIDTLIFVCIVFGSFKRKRKIIKNLALNTASL